MSTVTLYHGDCLDILPTLADASVDMVLCDLPYGTTACKWDVVIPFAPLWEQYRRVVKRNGAIVLFGSQPFTSALIASNPAMFRYDWAWDKKHPKGHLNARIMPLRRHEDVLVFGVGRLTYNPQMRLGRMRAKGGGNPLSNKGTYGKHDKPITINNTYYPTSVLEFTNANQRAKSHPNEKPVALCEYLIRTYTNEGDTVLDNTMGSGTTGVACVDTARDFIGIEKDAGYFAIAEKRIEAVRLAPRQLELIA